MASDDGALKEIGTYEKVLATFKQYDADHNGVIAYKELHKLMMDLTKGRWTKSQSDRLLLTVDKNRNGTVDINEFINYVFGSKGSGSSSNAYLQVLEQFRKFDTNRNGTLDKQEFTRLMCALKPGQWSQKHTDLVFHEVDADKSGEVDLDELVAYIFGVSKEAKGRIATSGGGFVSIEFVCGPGKSELVVKEIAKKWEKAFGKDVLTTKKVDRRSKGITKVSADNGNVLFWDDASMLPYADNPFDSLTSLKAWVGEMTHGNIPRMLQGAKIAFHKGCGGR